jgi:GAF domain-containing protein
VPIDRAALRAPQVARFLRRLLSDAVEAVRADEAALWIPSPDGTQLEAALNHGPSRDIVERISVPLNDSVVGLVFIEDHGTCIGPDDKHNPIVDEATGTPTRSMVAVPIHFGQEKIGVLSAINPREPRTFDHDDLDQMTWRAYLAGLIIRDHETEPVPSTDQSPPA